MNLEQQVVSLELAKKLKELGVKQEGYFKWSLWENKDYRIMSGYPRTAEPIEIICSAFTVAELGEIIPGNFSGFYCKYQWGFLHNRHFAFLHKVEDDSEVKSFEAKTEADARAKCLIYLLEQGIIKS